MILASQKDKVLDVLNQISAYETVEIRGVWNCSETRQIEMALQSTV